MAEAGGQDQERTEQPTQKRLDDARKQGQIPRSRELSMVLVMLAGAGALMAAGPFMAGGLMDTLHEGFSISRDTIFAADGMQTALREAIVAALGYLAPVLLATLVAALVAPLAIGGWSMNFEALMPKFSPIGCSTANSMPFTVALAFTGELTRYLPM